MIGDIVYVNGAFVKKDEASVSVFDHGFVYGDGIFEGLQAVNGGVFKLDAHLARLYRSARYMGFAIPLAREAFAEAVLETARRNGLCDGYLRPIVSRGAGPMGIRHLDKLGPPTIVIVAQHEHVEDRARVFERGLAGHVVSLRRIPSECLDARVKSCNYINNVLAYVEAKQAGADAAIMLDIHGNVAEGYGSNLFAVRDGVVMTPPLGNVLEGITRETVLEICRAEGIPCREPAMTVYDLVTAEEVFETATLAEVTPIVSIDGRVVGDGRPGSLTRRLHAELKRVMASGAHSRAIFTERERIPE
jgi:branched-chain amino acid aminotransferase